MSTRPRKTQRSQPKRAPRRARKNTQNRTFPLMNSVPANSTVRTMMPPEMDKILSYQVNRVIANPASIQSMIRFTPNGAFDVDPILGSTSTPGFAEWSNFYNYYRVVKVSYKFELSNMEGVPLRVYTILTNTDPGTIGNVQFPGNPLSKTRLLSGRGGQDRATLSDTKQVSAVVGTRGIEVEDNFRAPTNANPTDLIWLGIGAINPSSTFLPGGVTCVGHIKMWIRFFDAKNLFN